MTLDRMITTDISANIVAGLLRRRWTIKRIARAIGAPLEFVQWVQARKQVLTLPDIQAIAAQTNETASQLILDAITDIGPDVQPLFDVTRRSLRASAKLRAKLRRRTRKSRRASVKAA